MLNLARSPLQSWLTENLRWTSWQRRQTEDLNSVNMTVTSPLSQDAWGSWCEESPTWRECLQNLRCSDLVWVWLNSYWEMKQFQTSRTSPWTWKSSLVEMGILGPVLHAQSLWTQRWNSMKCEFISNLCGSQVEMNASVRWISQSLLNTLWDLH